MNSNRTIVFLDVDGVLINLKALKEHPQQADPDCVDRLNAITDELAAVIVVSSTWRKGGLEKVAGILEGWGVKADVIGVTPDLSNERESGLSVATTRGAEIKAWLYEDRPSWPPWPPFIIVDDESDMGDLRLHLLQTDTHLGLTDDDVQRALALFTDLYKSNFVARHGDRQLTAGDLWLLMCNTKYVSVDRPDDPGLLGVLEGEEVRRIVSEVQMAVFLRRMRAGAVQRIRNLLKL